MRRLLRRRLSRGPFWRARHRPGAAGSFVALCLGVTLLTMTGLVLTSGRPQPPERYAGTAVLVQSPAAATDDGTFAEQRPWSPETVRRLTEALGAIPGVRAAVPDRTFYAQPVLGGRPIGTGEVDDPAAQAHPWSSTALAPYRLDKGRAPADDTEAVVDSALGLAPGRQVTVLTAPGPVTYRVSGTIRAPGIHVTDAQAAARGGGVRVIGLVTDPGADPARVAEAARKAAGRQGQVLVGDARGALEPRGDARTRWVGMQVLTAMAALAGFVSVFVVASTFAFSVATRRREIGLLRAVGATPRQIRRGVLREALTTAALAGGLGVALGALTAPALADLLVLGGLQPAGFTVRFGALPLAGAYLGGLVIALLGAWASARRAAGVGPLEALREAAVDDRGLSRGRWVAGGGALVVGGGLLAAGVSSGEEDLITFVLFAAMASIVGLALLAPALVGPPVRALTRPLARGALGTLVRANLLTALRRTASTAAPVLLSVGMGTLIAGMFELRAHGFALEEAAMTRAERVLAPDGTPGLSDAAVARTSGGVALLPTTLYLPDQRPAAAPSAPDEPHRTGEPNGEGEPGAARAGASGGHVAAAGVNGDVLARTPSLRVVEGSLASVEGRSVAVAESTATRLGWRLGGEAPVIFEDGRSVRLRVVALLADGASVSDVLLDRDTVRAHDPSALTSQVYLPPGARVTPAGPGGAGEPGARPGVEVAELGARVADAGEYRAAADAEDDRLVRIFIAILIAMGIGYAVLSIAVTLLMASAARARDFAVLRLSGATQRQVLGMVTTETVLVVALGTVSGLAVAGTALLAMRAALSAELGVPVGLAFPWPAVLAMAAVCLAFAVLAAVAAAARGQRASLPSGAVAGFAARGRWGRRNRNITGTR